MDDPAVSTHTSQFVFHLGPFNLEKQHLEAGLDDGLVHTGGCRCLVSVGKAWECKFSLTDSDPRHHYHTTALHSKGKLFSPCVHHQMLTQSLNDKLPFTFKHSGM